MVSMEALCDSMSCDANFDWDEIDTEAVLFFAAVNDKRWVIERLQSRGLDLNATDNKGKNALFYANENRSMDTLCDLISFGAEFNLDEIDAKAVLHFAAVNNERFVIEPLHSEGLDLNATDNKGKSAVFYANENRSMFTLCDLIRCGAEFNLDEIDANAVLYFAAVNDQIFVFDQLHSKGLDLNATDDHLNATDDQGKTAVIYAKENGSMAALCDLIRCGAEFNFDEIDAKAVLDFAAVYNEHFVIEELHSKGHDLNAIDEKGKTAVFYANKKCSMAALCDLISCRAEFILDEIDAKAVLYFAAVQGKTLVIKQLHSKGLDLNATDDTEKTALFYANEKRSMDTLCELIECGAQFNLDEINAKAVLFFAAEHNYKKTIEPLCNAGLDLNTTDDEGKTVVFFCDENFLDCLTAVDDEVLINARDMFGRTPLFYAAVDNNTKKALHLIKKGGNLQLEDNCNVNVFSFFIQNCISRNIDALQLHPPPLFEDEHKTKALIFPIFDTIFCQSPLLSVSGSLPFPAFNKGNIAKALAFALDYCLIHDLDKVDDIREIASRIAEEEIDVPLVMFLLNRLGANPNAADSDGNTAVHYATLLPFFGVTEEAVMTICKKLRKFGSVFDLKNQQHESPLQLCLSPKLWKAVTEDNNWKSSMRGLVEICKFLLSNGCSIAIGFQNAESIFHRIISLIQQSLELTEDTPRMGASQVLMDIFVLLSRSEAAVRDAANKTDALLNSPLHLWASIALKSNQDYASIATEDHTFESILRKILDHLLNCGAKLNLRNCNEETPLHVCRTWIAVKLLLDAGANPNDVDASGNSPLLAAAKKKNSDNRDCLYPDVAEDQETFWRIALEKRLDPWVADKQEESVLNVLIKSDTFILARALVDAACKYNYATNEIKLSFLSTICKDESNHTHWKSVLVGAILNSAGTNQLCVVSPLRFCCLNIVKFGLFDNKSYAIQQNSNEESSYDDEQPPPKKRKNDESGGEKERKDKEEEKENDERKSDYSVHGEIAKQLLLYGVDIGRGDSGGISCLDIAVNCPPLKDLLRKPREIDTLPIIPWTSVSARFKSKLTNVARRQEYTEIDKIWYHRIHIGSGSFSLIFAGINSMDGREVAVKRTEKLRMQRAQDKREISNLTALADCEQVVRYISFFMEGEFSYIVLELMEGNLEECLDGSIKIDATQGTLLCKDVVMGLKFLHEQKIRHRDLKPQNILYKKHPKLCLKIADFGLSRKVKSVSTTVYGIGVGTRCWIAPEVLKCNTNSDDKGWAEAASDVFSSGMIFHYILSERKHPFSPTECENKSKVEISNKTEANVMNGKMDGWSKFLSPEASHLVKRMLKSNEKDRPSAQEALEHPLFWSSEKKKEFLLAVGNEEEFVHPRKKKTPRKKRTPRNVVTDLETKFPLIVKLRSWKNPRYRYMLNIYTGMTTGWGRNNYDDWHAVDLVRFIRNVYQHYNEKSFRLSVPIHELLFTDFVFFGIFPDLVIEVYKVITTHGWDKSRHDIKSAMNK